MRSHRTRLSLLLSSALLPFLSPLLSPASATTTPSTAPAPVPGDRSTYTIHNKAPEPISFKDLDSLPCVHAKSRSDMLTARRYITDASLYRDALDHLKLNADGCPPTKIKDAFLEELAAKRSITEIDRKNVKGHVEFFVVPEDSKARFRAIREPRAANAAFGKDTLLGIEFPKKGDICDLVNCGSHAAAFDFTGYYDQFFYDEEVSHYFCFRKGQRYFRTNRLCMGQRNGCDIGQSTTIFLLDFEGRRCKTYAYIDNVIFVGSKEDVLHDSKIFLERCRIGNVTVNEASDIQAKGLDAMVVTSLEWCGVSLDFTNKTAKLINKTLKKLELSWLNRANWTNRQFAAHIGLLFWTWGIIDVSLYKYYSLLKFISCVSTRMQQDETRWDEPCQIHLSALPALEDWTNIAFANQPRHVKRSSAPSWLVCTDASAWGWGYRAFNYSTGEIRRYGERWSEADKKAYFSFADGHKRSVYAEPRAVHRSLLHLFSNKHPNTSISFVDAAKDMLPPGAAPDERVKICVATDNSATQCTLNSGFASRSFDINRTIEDIKSVFPDTHFDIDVYFVPGKFNPGDKPSRGLKDDVNANTGTNVDDDNLRRLAGFGLLATKNFAGSLLPTESFAGRSGPEFRAS
jgi:hypothetical protein